MGSNLKRWSRFMVYRLSLSLLMGCAGPATHSAVMSGVTLDQIVAHNSATVGSGAGIQTMEIDLAMQDGDSKFDGIYRVTRDGRMRIDIIVKGQRVYTEAYDGKQGWDMEKDGSASVDPHGSPLWHGTQFPGNIFGLEDMRANGHKLEYLGRESVAGVDYYVVKLTLSDGFETYRFINPSTWMIERARDFRAFHPAVDSKETWVETVWSDYRPVQGVARAFSSVNNDLSAGKQIASQTVTGYKLNQVFDPAIFQMPSSAAK